MKLERSKEWWLARARCEGETVPGAGPLAFDPVPDERSAAAVVPEENRIAFGKFVNMMRRRQGLSIEQFADASDLDARELLVIEDDLHYVPPPRTVFKLAQIFKVPQPRLMQLAGLTVANDQGLSDEAVRFAARSEAVQRLSREESAALEAFVAVLSKQEHPRPT